jgi:flagellar motor switch protein FliG
VLLALLGEDVTASVLARLSPRRGDDLRKRLRAIEENPPVSEVVDAVLDDFERFLRFATNSRTGDRQQGNTNELDRNQAAGQAADGRASVAPFQATGDPIADLNRLEEFQIAGAMQDEHPRTIALVLSHLDAERASRSLRYLPPHLRAEVFLQLRDRPHGSEHLVRQIARATVEKGCTISEEEVVVDDAGTDQRLAEILRSMEKAERNEIMAVVEQHDPETASRVKERLYVFEDLANVEDRSLQNLLAMVEARTLATALKDADEQISKKVLKNLPKRAREMLSDEMELMGHVTQEQQETARKQIVAELLRLDQSGELVMET